MKQTTLEEVSAGGVVYRRVSESASQRVGLEFLIGKHSGYHKWVLPKGLVERGESPQEAAEREVMEEVGVVARVTDLTPLKNIEYWYYADLEEVINKNPHTEDTGRRVGKYQEEGGAKTRVHKQVIFFLMEVERDLGSAGWEMEERKWVTYREGMETLAFESEREVFVRAGEILGCSR